MSCDRGCQNELAGDTNPKHLTREDEEGCMGDASTMSSTVAMRLLCVCTDLGTMIADVMHPDLVSLQPCCGVDDFMDTVEAPSLRTGRVCL